MNLDEATAKQLVAARGVTVPHGEVAMSGAEAEQTAARLDTPVVVKAQVLAGRRGKQGGILFADTPMETCEAAERLLGSIVGEERVDAVLIEERVEIRREMYVAVFNDQSSRAPMLLFSAEGGVEIEEIVAGDETKMVRQPVDIRCGLDADTAREVVGAAGLSGAELGGVADALLALYRAYRELDAELLEINPIALDTAGRIVALDCKLTVDDAALPRHTELTEREQHVRALGTELERRGRDCGFNYLELPGDIGVLANGAGLTMTTMDVIVHYGGRPANFLEIGGQNYMLATPALELVLDNPNVRSLVVNFCGAFARTDVMVEGVIKAWHDLQPTLPVFFSVHGTGEEEAVRMLRQELAVEPFDNMDDAIVAAIEAAALKEQVA